MPAVDTAMARSLYGGLWGTMENSLARSIANKVVRRGIFGDKVSDIKKAFSSWGSCMAHAYCKWPVIAVIVVGGLIVLSILTCIIRCTCLGVSCCCSCFHCLKCCGNCCGCCDPPGGKPHKYTDEPYNLPQQEGYGYRQQAPMEAHCPPVPAGHSHGPQYAEFDMKHESDSLPAMPSWESANSKQVMLEEEGVEMDHLPKKSQLPAHRISPMPGHMPGAAASMPTGRDSPHDHSQGNATGYMNAHVQQPPNVYGGQDQGYDRNRMSDGYGLDQPYDVPPPAAIASIGPGRQSPAVIHNGYGPRQMTPRPAHIQSVPSELDGRDSVSTIGSPAPPYSLNSRMRSSPGPSQPPMRSPCSQNDHGIDPRMGSAPSPSHGSIRSPAPQNEYDMAPPRFSSPRPIPYRSYSPALQNSKPPPITNNSGFDFNSGYARPQTRDGPNYDRRPSESHESEGQEAYPGYKPYTPTQQTWSGV